MTIMPSRAPQPSEENFRSKVHQEELSECSTNERKSVFTVSSPACSEGIKLTCKQQDEKNKDRYPPALGDIGMVSTIMPSHNYRMDNKIIINGDCTNSQMSSDSLHYTHAIYPRDDTAETKVTVDYTFDAQPQHKQQRTGHASNAKALNSMGGGQCIYTFYTVIGMGIMFVALLVPALFHVCCQFRLYSKITDISEYAEDLSDPLSQRWVIVERLREFEYFFILGVLLYLCIQAVGFYATKSRINRYLWNLCCISVEESKHEFLYVSKQRILECFSDYAKRLCGDHQSNTYSRTEQDLIKAFDDASIKFDNSTVEDVWNQISLMRCRIMFSRIFLPLIIHVALSITTSVFVYDRRFRMHHRVPLAHPGILSNMYWYAAIQYEGVWCIFTMFLLNIVTWLYLCHTNKHKTIFGLLEDADDYTQKHAFEYGDKLAKSIWDDQMLLFSSTIYAERSSKVNRNNNYIPVRLETFSSQIKLNKTGTKKVNRPCLCQCLCSPSIEEIKSSPTSFMGPSPLEELHVPLLRSEMHEGIRHVNRVIE